MFERDADHCGDDLTGLLVGNEAARPERADLDVEIHRPQRLGGCGDVPTRVTLVEGFDRELNPLHAVRLGDGEDAAHTRPVDDSLGGEAGDHRQDHRLTGGQERLGRHQRSELVVRHESGFGDLVVDELERAVADGEIDVRHLP